MLGLRLHTVVTSVPGLNLDAMQVVAVGRNLSAAYEVQEAFKQPL